MILFTLTITGAGNIPPFPPSTEVSNFLDGFALTTKELSTAIYPYITADDGTITQMSIFPNETVFAQFLARNVITDPRVNEDLQTWKTSNGINYTLAAYTLTPVNPSGLAIF